MTEPNEIYPKNVGLVQHFKMNQKGKAVLIENWSLVPGAGLLPGLGLGGGVDYKGA